MRSNFGTLGFGLVICDSPLRGRVMDAMEGLWGGLPCELVERVLSFLSVLDLCRLRSVCRRWNVLVCKAEFHDLCEQNRKENEYLTIIRHHNYLRLTPGNSRFRYSTSFLDLDSRRWYSLKPCGEVGAPRAALSRERKPHWMFAMDHGLVCYSSVTNEGVYTLVISDPIARTRKELPELPVRIVLAPVPFIVTAAISVTRSYRVFVITHNRELGIYVYESVTNEWRAVKSPPEHLGVRTALSVVSFGGMMYVIFRLVSRYRFVLLSYDPQEDVWKLLNLRMPKNDRLPELVVSCNRLFVMMWINESSAPEHGSQRESHLQFLFEMREVLAAENSSRMVAQLTLMNLQQMFGEEDSEYGPYFDIAYGVPRCSSSGSCKSLVLMSFSSGKLISYDMASGSVVALPAPPAESNESEVGDHARRSYAQGKYTNLSLRSLSSPSLE